MKARRIRWGSDKADRREYRDLKRNLDEIEVGVIVSPDEKVRLAKLKGGRDCQRCSGR